MHTVIEREKLVEAVKVATLIDTGGFDFTPDHYIAVVRNGDLLHLHFRDNNHYARVSVEPSPGVSDWADHQGVCLPKKEVFRFLKASNGATVKITVTGDIATLECGRSRMKAKTIELDAFPFPSSEKIKGSLRLTATALRNALALCSVCIDDKGMTSVVGVSMETDPEDGTVHVLSTNGRAMAHSTVPVLGNTAQSENVSIAMTTATTLVKFLSEMDDQEISLEIGEQGLTITGTHALWTFRSSLLADKKDIPWRRMLETSSTMLCRLLNLDDFGLAIDAATAISDDKHSVVALSVGDDGVMMEFTNEIGVSRGAAEAEVFSEYAIYVPIDAINAFNNFCKKYGNGLPRIHIINSSKNNPMKLECYKEEQQSAGHNPTLIVSPYVNN
ncbi:MAG: hypothetical protein M1346_01105 [Gammaproteobacteria bacterium]|nr:hypothetical protein [Gammaproteobacteria bacterium]